jgi:hypothetical protein
MIIIGDMHIPYEDITKVETIEDIKSTKPNSTVLFQFDKDMMVYCMDNNINYAVIVGSVKHAVYANCLKAKYILPIDNDLNDTQKVAENYMFDSKILATIENEYQIGEMALRQIDGVIFNTLLI